MEAQKQYTLLDGVSASGAGSTFEINANPKTFQTVKSGTATVAVQKSNDGTNWVDINSDASGIDEYTGVARFYRGNVTAYTSGTITVTCQI